MVSLLSIKLLRLMRSARISISMGNAMHVQGPFTHIGANFVAGWLLFLRRG